MTDSSGATFSVVVPVYGCAGCLEELVERINATLKDIVESWEIVLVDDRSPDQSWATIERLAARDTRVSGLRLSRNFGQHPAITAGLDQATGDWVAVMDCDLQDPPEVLKDLWAKAQDGYDIVLARRGRRPEGYGRRYVKALYYRLLQRVLSLEIEPGVGTFSLISRKVVDASSSIGDRERNYLLILHWLGFRRATIDIAQAPRAVGRSSYDRRALMRLAVDGLFFQTTHLLRWIVIGGFFVAAAGGVGAIVLVLLHFIFRPPSGYTSLAVLLLFFAGVIITCTGIAALYIGRVFEHVKDRPPYVVDRLLAATGDQPERGLLADESEPMTRTG